MTEIERKLSGKKQIIVNEPMNDVDYGEVPTEANTWDKDSRGVRVTSLRKDYALLCREFYFEPSQHRLLTTTVSDSSLSTPSLRH